MDKKAAQREANKTGKPVWYYTRGGGGWWVLPNPKRLRANTLRRAAKAKGKQ